MINRLIAWCWAEIDRAIAGLNAIGSGFWVQDIWVRDLGGMWISADTVNWDELSRAQREYNLDHMHMWGNDHND